MADENSDVLWGYSEIGEYLRLSSRQVKHEVHCGRIPTFLRGRLRGARRSTLNAWLAEREAEARKARPDA